MDVKTERRIAQFKAQQREKRTVQKQLSGKASMTAAERARKEKLRKAKKNRPGFGSSSSSVADHLNEVVGLVEHKLMHRLGGAASNNSNPDAVREARAAFLARLEAKNAPSSSNDS
ncbi:Hypothetical Protein FCC1311_091072 [Hondaea fermentalgiana]|uniref:Uncharacterized protein n=1 Tax=Hondaea fermentalgiana TaxID=2315210 RepID=A0A2R5GPT1_9STRA|nr:Hypothetical Protein FCC1311_091072 [Hondaea fermentalgiana]|eukprot:GBG32882.1 Hypothetical Protein FCC1311_091072 [Hondaea fermentalgiana]